MPHRGLCAQEHLSAVVIVVVLVACVVACVVVVVCLRVGGGIVHTCEIDEFNEFHGCQ